MMKTSLLFTVLGICCTFIATGNVDDGEKLIPVNGTLSLTCTLNGYDGELDSRHAFFEHVPAGTKRHLPVPAEYQHIVDNRTVRLLWSGVQLDLTGEFHCMINETGLVSNRSRIVAISEVMVVKPPEPITDITCVSDNGYNLTCQWCHQPEDGVRYQLEWAKYGPRTSTCTPAMQKYGPCTCHWPYRDAPGDVHPDDVYSPAFPYRMHVRSLGILPNHTATSPEYDAVPRVIVKPRPPNVTVTSDGMGGATVIWNRPPLRMPNPDALLEYNVTWSCARGHQTRLTQDLMLELPRLLPYTSYDIQVTARLYPDGLYQSDPATTSLITPEAVPSAAPAMTEGMFRTVESNSFRNVIIFWEPVPRDHMNGAFAGYTIRVLDTSDQSEREYFVPEEGMYHAQLESLRLERAYNISVVASTGAGEGPPASLHLPSAPGVLRPPFYVDGVINGSHALFTIMPPEGINVTSYTLLSCPGISTIQYCQGAPVTITLDSDLEQLSLGEYSEQNEYSVSVDGYTPQYVYSVAVNSGESTSGLGSHWLCLYDWNGDPGQPDFEFNQNQPQRALSLRWDHLECSNTVRGKVATYNIHINASGTIARHFSVSAVYGRQRYSYTAEGLQPSTRYFVQLEACTRSRCGALRGSEYTTLPEPFPVVYTVIAPFCLFVLVVSIAAACYCKRKCKREVRIVLPDFNTPEITEHNKLMSSTDSHYAKGYQGHPDVDTRDTDHYSKMLTRNDWTDSAGPVEDSGVDSGASQSGSVSRSGSSRSQRSDMSESIEMYSLADNVDSPRTPQQILMVVTNLDDVEDLRHSPNLTINSGNGSSSENRDSGTTDVHVLQRQGISSTHTNKALCSLSNPQQGRTGETSSLCQATDSEEFPQVIVESEDISGDPSYPSDKSSDPERSATPPKFSDSYVGGSRTNDKTRPPEGLASPTLADESLWQTFDQNMHYSVQ